MRRDNSPLPLRHAIALGLLHGPTELLPISSSGHTTLIPWLAKWPYEQLDPDLRKSFEVALHAGAAAALLADLGARGGRGTPTGTMRGRGRDHAQMLALSLIPAAVVGSTLERHIERRLSGPGTVAAGLLGGAVCMALADRRGPDSCESQRTLEDVGALDGLLLGVAQAVALIPGVSRNGATLSAARARGFARGDAHTLSWQIALPVLLGASALKGLRLARSHGVPANAGGALASGAATAFLSTLASARLMHHRGHDRSLLPYAIYRGCLAAVTLQARRLRGAHNRNK
jgi:undecaprenyl-diphosphatase